MDIDKLLKSLSIADADKLLLKQAYSSLGAAGLNWERKPEKAQTDLAQNSPVLVDQPEYRIGDVDVSINHMLIEGENLHSLAALNDAYKEGVDLVYIDPPYNTGSKDDFVFNDHFVAQSK